MTLTTQVLTSQELFAELSRCIACGTDGDWKDNRGTGVMCKRCGWFFQYSEGVAVTLTIHR